MYNMKRILYILKAIKPKKSKSHKTNANKKLGLSRTQCGKLAMTVPSKLCVV